MRDVLVAGAVRTPIGRFGGALSALTPAQLGVRVPTKKGEAEMRSDEHPRPETTAATPEVGGVWGDRRVPPA